MVIFKTFVFTVFTFFSITVFSQKKSVIIQTLTYEKDETVKKSKPKIKTSKN